MTKGRVAPDSVLLLVTVLIGLLAITSAMGRIPGLQEELRDETVNLAAKRVEVSAYALDGLDDDVNIEGFEDSIEMELELPDDYTVSQEDLEERGESVILTYRENYDVIDPPTEAAFVMDPDFEPEASQPSSYICLRKESNGDSTITISGGEC